MNPRIEIVLDGEYVLGLIDGKEMLAAGLWYDELNQPKLRISSSSKVPGDLEMAMLYAECIKAVVDKCNELQSVQEAEA